MLFAHKLLDAVYGRDDKYELHVRNGTPDEVLDNFINALGLAEKFDFGELHFERDPESGKYRLPDLTDDEKGFWIEGLIPLPSDISWYEYELGGKRNGLLVTSVAGEGIWIAQRIDARGEHFWFDGVVLGIDRKGCRPDSISWAVIKGGNQDVRATPEVQMSMMADIMMSVYLTLMLNSKSTEVAISTPPIKLNAARKKRGVTPLFPHRVVHIVPKRYTDEAEKEAGKTRTSPKLHWRRSHLRRYDRPTPKAKPMGDGVWAVVIARQLVGKAELGEVSHEYKVG